jgi:hypothetical protein
MPFPAGFISSLSRSAASDRKQMVRAASRSVLVAALIGAHFDLHCEMSFQ